MGKENRNYYRKGLTKVPPATQGVSALLHILILIFSIEEFCNIFDSKIFPMQHKSHLASNLRPTHHHFHHQQTLTVSPPKNTFIDPSRYYPESPQKLNFHSVFFFFSRSPSTASRACVSCRNQSCSATPGPPAASLYQAVYVLLLRFHCQKTSICAANVQRCTICCRGTA